MADIYKWLQQTPHIEKAKQEMMTRESLQDYLMKDTEYKLPLGKLKDQGGDMQQFCSFYYKRLE